LGAMTHREYLAEADRLIAECKNRIARHREIIASAYESGHPTVLPVSLLRVLEENLHSFEKTPSANPRSAKKHEPEMTGIRNAMAQDELERLAARRCERGWAPPA